MDGDTMRGKYNESRIPPIRDRANYAVSGSAGTYGPTKTSRYDLDIAASEFRGVEKELNKLLQKSLPSLFKDLNAAGVPWSKGR